MPHKKVNKKVARNSNVGSDFRRGGEKTAVTEGTVFWKDPSGRGSIGNDWGDHGGQSIIYTVGTSAADASQRANL